jgi:hypothetical protein
MNVTNYKKAKLHCQKCKTSSTILDAKKGGTALNVQGIGKKWSGKIACEVSKKWKEMNAK